MIYTQKSTSSDCISSIASPFYRCGTEHPGWQNFPRTTQLWAQVSIPPKLFSFATKQSLTYFCSMLAAPKYGSRDFPGGLVVKIQASTAGGACSIPGLGTKITQFSSVAQLCPTLCDPMNCSTPGLPVHHQLPEFTQTHVHRVSDAIQPSHPVVPFSSRP